MGIRITLKTRKTAKITEKELFSCGLIMPKRARAIAKKTLKNLAEKNCFFLIKMPVFWKELLLLPCNVKNSSQSTGSFLNALKNPD
ncbi:MAG: hypothetical protein PHD95_04110 [Candidatus ainarchaeum sp.]|nr:hypothetical protein [Candidatus ainarchaeum sp.]